MHHGPSAAKLFAIVALLSALFGATVVFAPAASAEPRMNVALGFSGWHQPGADLAVQIEVDADRLISGRLVISVAGRNGVGEQSILDVEVAGGSTKRFIAVLPSVTEWNNQVSVQLIESNVLVATSTTNVSMAKEGELVGVLASLTDNLPARVALSVELGEARLTAIDDTMLAAGAGALDALGTIAATDADLDGLTEQALVGLRTWLTQGGTLLVDELPGPVPGLAASTGDRPVAYGAGRLVASSGTLALGEWDGAISPTGARQSFDDGFIGEITGDVVWFGGPLADSLAEDAGIDLPPLSVVLPLMAIYVLIVGPLAFWFLRRLKRPRLLWLVLPAVAAVFTAGVWISGSVVRSNTRDAHGTVIELHDGRASAQSTVLRTIRNGGLVTLDLEPGWRPFSANADFRFDQRGSGSLNLRRVGDGTRIESDLDAGEFVTMGAVGLVPEYDDGIEITASSPTNGNISATVTNNFGIGLQDVVLFAGPAGVNVGDIEAGQTIDIDFDAAERNPRFGEPIEFEVWRDALNSSEFGPFGPIEQETGAVNISLWSQFLISNAGNARPIGQLVVAGWTDELDAPIGNNISNGRTLVVAYADVEPENGTITNLSSKRSLLRGPNQDGGGIGFGGEFVISSSWRFDLPEQAAVDQVGLDLPDSVRRIELWDGERWVIVEDINGGFYSLPESAIINGAVYVKPHVNFDQNPQLGRNFTVRTIGPDEIPDTTLADRVTGLSS